MLRDLHNNIAQKVLLMAAITTDTATVSAILDTVEHTAHEVVVALGTITDGDYVIKLEEGDDVALSDAADVAAEDMLVTTANLTFADTEDDVSMRVGYIGSKRYFRVSIASTNTTTGVDKVVVLAIQGNSKFQPTTDVKA